MNTTSEHSAAAFSKVADQETKDLRLYNDDFLNRLQAITKFKDRTHKTYQQIHVPELNRRLQLDPHLPLPDEDASPLSPEDSHDSFRGRGGDVDRAASRVVDEVAATEMARAVVGLCCVVYPCPGR